MAYKVNTESQIAERIREMDFAFETIEKLLKDQGKAKGILVHKSHLKTYGALINRLRFLERHLSNLVLTNSGSVVDSE